MARIAAHAGDRQLPNGAPDGFAPYFYRKVFRTPHGVDTVWAWLNDPATFVEGQF